MGGVSTNMSYRIERERERERKRDEHVWEGVALDF